MNLEELELNLNRTWELLKSHENNSTNQPILASNKPEEVKQKLSEIFPSSEQAFEDLLKDFEAQILPFLNKNTDVRFGAYITGSGNRISAIAEFIKAFFKLTFSEYFKSFTKAPIKQSLNVLIVSRPRIWQSG